MMNEDIENKILETLNELSKSQKNNIWRSVSLSFILSVIILIITIVVTFTNIQRDVNENTTEIKTKSSINKINDKLMIINFNFNHIKDKNQIIYPVPLIKTIKQIK